MLAISAAISGGTFESINGYFGVLVGNSRYELETDLTAISDAYQEVAFSLTAWCWWLLPDDALMKEKETEDGLQFIALCLC